MIPKECKRLAEVDFPIAIVSEHSIREKPIVHHHPQSFHQWWARRPLAACRAMLLALLLPDPCDSYCPPDFLNKARAILGDMVNVSDGREGLQKALLKFIGDVANWDVASSQRWISVARSLVKAAYPEESPLVVDPFAGGGSIPIEALRLGCDTFATDLNLVACLILKVMLEDIPRHGPELVDEFRRAGKRIKEQAERDLKEFYSDDPDGAKPLAYLWARTVLCESPNCGAEIPLVRSLWLCKKANRKRALRRVLQHTKESSIVEFEVFTPKSDTEVSIGTVTRARATCLCCGAVLPPERVRAQLAAQHGGADVVFDLNGKRIGGARLLAVVTLRPGESGRHYRLPTESDYQAVCRSQKRVNSIIREWQRNGKNNPCPIPDEPVPTRESHRAVGSQLPLYDMSRWSHLFTARQLITLRTLCDQVSRTNQNPVIQLLLALVVSRLADRNASLVGWDTGGEKLGHVFNRQALPMVWDFAESSPLSDASGSLENVLSQIAGAVGSIPTMVKAGQVQVADAQESPLPSGSVNVWFTDPPYYDAVPYADLADFFLVWLKRALPDNKFLHDPFDPSNPLSQKKREAVQCEKTLSAEGKPKDRIFYESAMAKAFTEGRRVLDDHGIGAVVFAHKTTQGWEALLSGMIKGGWTITGSWPIATERAGRLNALDTASLATSVHLICRPRAKDAPIGDWVVVLKELPKRVGDWMERLQSEGVRGADLVFACIGPALEIFSRYSHVETADGHEIKLDEYLLKVWEVVGRTALEQILGTAEARARNGAAGALEEDARLTALFLWTLQSSASGKGNSEDQDVDSGDDTGEDEDEEAPKKAKTKGYSLIYDVVRRFAQPLGIALPKWEGRIIQTEKGVVTLLSISERATQLFGEQDASSVADWLERDSENKLQLVLFPEMEEAQVPKIRGKKGRIVAGTEPEMKKDQEATTLDRVHAAMLLQAGGKANALRALLKAEQERGQDFLRLANALSALYPSGSEEKRLLEAMLLGVPK